MAHKFNISMPDEVFNEVVISAKKLGLSRSSYITMAVAEKLEKEKAIDMMPRILEEMQKAMMAMPKPKADGTNSGC